MVASASTMISPNISPKELSVWERLRRLDFHPKTKEDFRVRTAYGGASKWEGGGGALGCWDTVPRWMIGLVVWGW